MYIYFTSQKLNAFFMLLLSCSAFLASDTFADPDSPQQTQPTWYDYPSDAKQFNYQTSELKEVWPKLNRGSQFPWPDQQFIETRLQEFPAITMLYQIIDQQKVDIPAAAFIPEEFQPIVKQLKQGQTTILLKDIPADFQPLYLAMTEQGVHPAIKQLLAGNSLEMQQAIQQAWLFHLNGQYEKAYQLGMRLGPLAFDPAIYAYLMHATFMFDDKQKEQADNLLLVANYLEKIKAIAGKNYFPRFAIAYARLRYLDTLSTLESRSTGWIEPLLGDIKFLLKQNPQSIDFHTMKGGFYAGMVGRVGSTVASWMYDVEQQEALDAFSYSVEKDSSIAQTFNEYAFALSRIDTDEYKKDIKQLLTYCLSIKTYYAHEELNRLNCKKQYQTLWPEDNI